MKKVIISENIHTFLERDKNIFSREEIMLFKAFTGEEVLKTHRLENADLIIIDLDIPGMQGDTVCKLIRKDKKLKSVSIIIICTDDTSAISRCQVCGANAFVTKPIKSEELISRIIRLLHVAKRKSLRVILYVAVKVRSKYEFFFANSENISTSGMLFFTDRDLREGAKVKCTFYLGKSMVEAEGDIVRVARKDPKRYSCGMRFITLPQPAQAHIEKFITDVMEGPPDRA